MSRLYSRKEVEEHNKKDDAWLIIRNKIYNITNWGKKHPGGPLIFYYRGTDATDAFEAFHKDLLKVEKFLKPLYVGDLAEPLEVSPLIQDFRSLRKKYVEKGLFSPSFSFFFFQIFQVLMLELIGFLIMYFFNSYWLGWVLASLTLATSQIQAGWSQHDYGHFSVFQNRKWNVFMHHFTIGFLKGASVSWWQTRHNRHHAKTNVMHKDPDIHNWPLFIFGERMGKMKLGWSGTKYQHIYWWPLGPPLVTTVLFMIQILHHIFKNRCYADMLSISLFFVRWMLAYAPILGIVKAFGLYFIARTVESLWFTWVTSMSHLPMDISEDNHQDWVSLHVSTTQDVEHSLFNDWFSGHLNFQIEHHLFPLMPRHNLWQVQQDVQELCKKHGLPMKVVSLYQAFRSVYESLLVARSAYLKVHSEQQTKNVGQMNKKGVLIPFPP